MVEHRLLIVDDDLAIHRLFSDIAQNCGYLVNTADDILSVSTVYKKFQPTLIFLDLSLTEGDGVEVLRLLSEHGCKSPIVVISSHDDKVRATTVRLGESRGLMMAGTFQKPIDIKTLTVILNKYKNYGFNFNEQDIERAIKNHEFILHYQPKVLIKTKEIIGAEALVRWQVPSQKNLIYPDAFIPFSEKTGSISNLSRYIIQQAIKQIHEHQIDFQLSINLSGRDLTDLSLPDEIVSYVKKYRIDPAKICFEITETSVMSQPTVAMDILTRLRIHGFELSMDDFGIGYSSLIELHRMPFSELKIDKSFIKNLSISSDTLPIVRCIINLGKGLSLKVVAEGVETQEAWNILEKEECHYAQGYFISQPLDISSFLDFVKKNKSSTSS
ncbi:MAG: hypothetical protein BGO43_08145 [Gammaproteobacteria bacterium 39-13]|nr:EAL domain-containing response regulator [Gammaproteobacteria bacterium]OJV91642.1 MAG: hypothetical protein BGO43_08145 [Gammaproteobacteria bacterium 39-13]